MKAFALIATAAAISAVAPAGAQAADAGRCHGQPVTFRGTAGDDRITDERTKLGRDPVIDLGGGDDTLELGSASYSIRSLVVCAGGGDDDVTVYESVGARSYLLDGEEGSDWIGNADDADFSYLSPMTVIGGSGNDHLRGANSPDRLVGGSGDDRAFGLSSSDRISGGSGDDALFGLGSGDTLLGGEGDDVLDGDSPYWTGGDDVADGGPDRDRCEAEIKRDCER